MSTGEDHVALIKALGAAVDRGDEDACRSLLAEDCEYTFVSQGTHRGRDEVARVFLNDAQATGLSRDLFTADGSGRVWWRYSAEWTDSDSGRQRRTSGATVAVINDGKVASLTSWIDVVGASQDLPD